MNRCLQYAIIALLISTLFSCREDFEYAPLSSDLVFSRDTVYLDTVFSNIGSSTYSLKVYNTTDEAVNIPEILLESNNDSKYRINVNGSPGKAFTNVPLAKGDSLYIFIETTLNIEDLSAEASEFLYTDNLLFRSGSREQKVALVTLVKDAVFMYPKRNNGIKESIEIGLDENGEPVRIEGFELSDEELHFTSDRPYVIYGYAAVPEGKTLAIDPGSRVHFHEGSGIYVMPGGKLEINGALSDDQESMENEVIFEGDRLEPEFARVPGQWGTIWIATGSNDNTINHLTIKNAIAGIIAEGRITDKPTLNISNSKILNSGNMSLLSRDAWINAENSIFGNAGLISVYCTQGGFYRFLHCTIANYWDAGFRATPALLIDNYITTIDGSLTGSDLVMADFSNCIIYGNKNREFILDRYANAEFNFNFDHSLLHFEDLTGAFEDIPDYDFSNTELYNTVTLNTDPLFRDPFIELFMIEDGSGAIDIGNVEKAQHLPDDLSGRSRLPLPDAGALEYQP
ncbi:hypothetical protein [Robertkochia solimangrovi]|uniref:hypothetical protein n=1 Tax=Robertkochia solimangrovi TaxID=2213046 RepID=UPI00117E1B02|nr:hypothetical protein [Robertkochia solimangrovi]TRZ45179.1 hypothetical protein DMZ48_05360 [Robertkochia solimangrovi]